MITRWNLLTFPYSYCRFYFRRCQQKKHAWLHNGHANFELCTKFNLAQSSTKIYSILFGIRLSIEKPWQILLKKILFISNQCRDIKVFKFTRKNHATRSEVWQYLRTCKRCKFEINIAFSNWRVHLMMNWVVKLWLSVWTYP